MSENKKFHVNSGNYIGCDNAIESLDEKIKNSKGEKIKK